MAQAILLSAAVFSFPIGIHFFRLAFPVLRKINPIVAAYIFGLLLVNTGIIGDEAFPVLDIIATVTVCLSIPLMLFQSTSEPGSESRGRQELQWFWRL